MRTLIKRIHSFITCCLPRRRSFEWQLLLAGAVIICAAWMFIEVADEVNEGDTRTFDQFVLRSLRDASDPQQAIGPEWFSSAMRDVTSFGDTVVLLLVILAISGYLLIERKYHAAALVLTATITGQIMSSVLKFSFQRDRPDIVPHLTDVMTASFPSGHSMMSAVVYLTLGALLMRVESRRATKLYTLGIAVLITALVGISRVYLGVHYPTDVMAGWLVGLTWALLCWGIALYLQQRGAVEKPADEELAAPKPA